MKLFYKRVVLVYGLQCFRMYVDRRITIFSSLQLTQNMRVCLIMIDMKCLLTFEIE